MKNEPNTKRLKMEARCLLEGRHGRLAGITAILILADLVLNLLVTAAYPNSSSTLSMILILCLGMLVNVIYYILLAGFYRIILNLCRDLPFRWTDLFWAFREHPEPVAIFGAVQYLLTFAFAQVCYWFAEGVIITVSSSGTLGSFLTDIVLFVISLVLFAYIEIAMSMFLYIHADDPWINFRETLSKAWALLSGLRWRYLYMQLSFLVIYALGFLSFGIGFLFTRPYVRTTEALFYLDISDQA